MNRNRLASLAMFLPLILSLTTFGQPLCLHHDSLDWLVLDTPVVVRARLMSLDAIEGHPKLSELKIDVIESIRGDVEGSLRIPMETSREGSWARRLVDSQNEVLLFFVEKPRGYQEQEVGKVIKQYDPALYYFWRIELNNPRYVFTMDMNKLHDGDQVLKKVRQLASEVMRPKPARYTFQLLNADSFTVPLNERMESIANKWSTSPDETKRRYGEIVQWGFKRHRNKPFESGYWYAKLNCPGGDVRFGLRIDHDKSNKPFAMVINGSQVIQVKDVSLQESDLRIEFPHHNSVITASVDRKALKMKGAWRKRAGKKDRWSELPFSASMKSDRSDSDYRGTPNFYDFYGKWQVELSASKDHAVAEFDTSRRGSFRHKDVRQFRGTVLSESRDFRFLAGDLIDGKLELSTFDGATAILFRAELVSGGNLKGDLWSSDRHNTWTATRHDSP